MDGFHPRRKDCHSQGIVTYFSQGHMVPTRNELKFHEGKYLYLPGKDFSCPQCLFTPSPLSARQVSNVFP